MVTRRFSPPEQPRVRLSPTIVSAAFDKRSNCVYGCVVYMCTGMYKCVVCMCYSCCHTEQRMYTTQLHAHAHAHAHAHHPSQTHTHTHKCVKTRTLIISSTYRSSRPSAAARKIASSTLSYVSPNNLSLNDWGGGLRVCVTIVHEGVWKEGVWKEGVWEMRVDERGSMGY